MSSRLHTVADVVRGRLCLGCGACAYICPDHKIRLADFLTEGIRPVLANESCGTCSLCLQVCPAYENDQTDKFVSDNHIHELATGYGRVLEVWEGHAADPNIRFAGSSGGLITALAAYCLDHEGSHGVLHIGGDPEDPVRNKTALSRSRQDLMQRTGSRYAPASACDRLDLIESAPAPCVFIGQPSEVTAAQKAAKLRPKLARNLALTISFFCAGSPSTQGTIELLRKMGVEPTKVQNLRYRGNGWPGHFAPIACGESQPIARMTYQESWGFLQAYRPFSVHLTPDGTGEDADISCGDPWYRKIEPDEPGSSLVLVRTQRGRELLQRAIAARYVVLTPASPDKLLNSQRNLVSKRGAIWGRFMALRLLRLPAPKLKGFHLFKNWLALSLSDKLRSTLGTMRRAIARGYFRDLKLDHATAKFASRPSSADLPNDANTQRQLQGAQSR